MASVEENRKEPEDILRIQAGFCRYFGKQSHERLLYHSMRKPTLISTFVLTAGGAFALGWLARTNTDTGPEDDAGKLERSAKSSARYRSSRPASSSTTRDSESSGKIEAFLARYSSGGTISPEDMAAAVEGMRRENDPILRRRLFSELLENLSPENAPAAYLALQGGRRGWGPGGGEELRLLTHAWGRLDGAGAVKALTEMQEAREAEGGERRGRRGGRDGEGGGYDLMSVISGWASSDGRSAADYVTSLEDERQQRMLAHGVIRGMMVNGVDEAMSYVASLPRTEDGGRTQSWYMSTIAGEVLEEGLDSAKSWADTISDPALRGGALSRVAETAVREDLEGAVEWVTQYAGEEAGRRAVNRVADEWAEQDPKAVLTWADSLPEAAQTEAYGEAFEEWARRDPGAAGEHLANMQPSPARDAAVEEYATTLAREEPVTAIKWAETIAREDQRTETLTRVARRWYYSDREAASEWIAKSGLPPEAVEEVTAEGRGFDSRGGGRPPRGR